jgi:hypothetical protein
MCMYLVCSWPEVSERSRIGTRILPMPIRIPLLRLSSSFVFIVGIIIIISLIHHQQQQRRLCIGVLRGHVEQAAVFSNVGLGQLVDDHRLLRHIALATFERGKFICIHDMMFSCIWLCMRWRCCNTQRHYWRWYVSNGVNIMLHPAILHVVIQFCIHVWTGEEDGRIELRRDRDVRYPS